MSALLCMMLVSAALSPPVPGEMAPEQALMQGDCAEDLDEELLKTLQALDQELQERLRRVEIDRARGVEVETAAAVGAARISLQLRHLGSRHEAAREGGCSGLPAKLHQLLLVARNLEVAAHGLEASLLPEGALRPGRGAVSTVEAGEAVPPNDDCALALDVGFGSWTGDTDEATNDGQASCGASFYSPDVWFRFVADADGRVFADTFGSAYDTVLSVHGGCPGSIDNQIVCNDDAFGLQSAVSFQAAQGVEYLIRVSGAYGASGAFVLRIDSGGEIEGEVTDTVTGSGLPNAWVDIFASDGTYSRTGTTEANGVYSVPGLGVGTYFAVAQDILGTHMAELYDGIQCPGGPGYGCDPTDGTPIAVDLGVVTTGIDFALDDGAVITGTVTDAATAGPVAGAYMTLVAADGSGAGSDVTDATGSWEVAGLPTGTYFVVAEHPGYRDELYDDLPCEGGPGSGCDPTTGTAVTATVDTTTGGIDFGLDRFGDISGTVTHTQTGLPVVLLVEVYDPAGDEVASASTDVHGEYTVGGLAPDTFFVRTVSDFFADEVYDDLPCEPDCDETSGTPVAVSMGGSTTGIDFVLDLLGGVTGQVTATGSGAPVPGVRVEVWDAGGSYLRSDWTDSAGVWEVERLAMGDYFVVGVSTEYADELYDDLPCPGGPPDGCDAITGTPVAVVNEATTSGVDMVLDRMGVVSGGVVDADTGEPVRDVDVTLWSSVGLQVGQDRPDASGLYSVVGLEPGNYFVATRGLGSSAYVDELYDDLPCPGGPQVGCDPTSGSPVEAALNTTTSGIDFGLGRAGALSGTVTDRPGGAPLNWVYVSVWDASGDFVSYALTDGTGEWLVEGLLDGTYFAVAEGDPDHATVLYDGIPCPGGPFHGCDPTNGTPLAAQAGTTTSGVDFALERLGALSGMITDSATGSPVPGLEVSVYDRGGGLVGSALSDGAGIYTVDRLSAGVHFARADGGGELADELYDDIPCRPWSGCDPRTGTPIVVDFDATTLHVDFQLDRTGGIAGTVVQGHSSYPLDDVLIRVWDDLGVEAAGQWTDPLGTFGVGQLPPGTYFVTAGLEHHLDELYDDIPCVDGPPLGCDATRGTPVVVAPGSVAAAVDFELDFLGDGLSGRVTEVVSGSPLAGVRIDLWHTGTLGLVHSVVSGPHGGYLAPVDPGEYFVSTDSPSHVNEIFDDVQCPLGSALAGLCDPSSGIPVIIAAGGVTPDVDFDLVWALVFGDGFESGDTSTWAGTTP